MEPLPDPSGSYSGTLNLTVTSGAARAGLLTVEYLQDGGGRYNALLTSEDSPVAPSRSYDAGRAVLRPERAAVLQLQFELPKGESASWLEGQLLLRLAVPRVKVKSTGKVKKSEPAFLLIGVKAEFRPLDEVTFQPSALTLQMTSGDLEGGDSVVLAGPAAESLLEREPPFSASVLLGNDEGNRVKVTLDELTSEGPEEVTARIVAESASPGEYKGSLTLGQGANAAQLELTLKSRRCVLLAILLVLFSSIVGGFVPAFSSTARVRSLLRLRLKNAVERLEGVYGDSQGPPRFLWDMSQAMGPRPWLGQKWSAVSEVDGIAGLYAELRWARSDEDLEELKPKVATAVERISCWLVVYEPARRLYELSHRQGVPDRHGTNWAETSLAADTEALLDSLKREPPKTFEDALARAKSCNEQYWWQLLMLETWTKIAVGETSPELETGERAYLGQVDLGKLIDPATAPSKASAEQMTVLATALSQQLLAIKNVVPKLDSLARPTAKTKDDFIRAVELTQERPGNVWGKVEASGQILEDEACDAAAPRADDRGEKALQRFQMVDWLLTSVLAIGATLAYVVPLYTSTWGTGTDLLTALAAGFGTQVVVQWAGMPIFRSIRQRVAESKPDEPKPETDPAA